MILFGTVAETLQEISHAQGVPTQKNPAHGGVHGNRDWPGLFPNLPGKLPITPCSGTPNTVIMK